MSEALEKAAHFSPQEYLLLSTLIGGGSFAGMRLLTDLSNKLNPTSLPNHNIKLQIPNPYKKQEIQKDEVPPELTQLSSPDPGAGVGIPAITKSADLSTYNPFLAVALGLPAGFLGTKLLYDQYQEGQANSQIEEAKKKYMHQLALAQQTNNKLAEETPNVDSICEAMAEEIEKKADAASLLDSSFPYAHPSHIPMWLLQNHPGAVGSAPPPNGLSGKEFMRNYPHDAQTMAAAHSDTQTQALTAIPKAINTAGGRAPGVLLDLSKLLAAGTGIGFLGLLLHNHYKKQEKEMKSQYPTGVEYAT